MSVLKLSLMWQMTKIHDFALRKIRSRIDDSDDWVAVLRVSTQLRIPGLRDLSIRILSERLGPPRMIELAIECNIQPWLLQGYTDLVTREQVISVEDEEQLGWTRTFNLFCVRHRLLETSDLYQSARVQSDIQSTFASEFASIMEFDDSPVSYLRPELYTTTDPNAIQRDKVYYHVDIIFSVNFSISFHRGSCVSLSFAGGRYFIQASSMSVRGKLGDIPRHVFTSYSRRHPIRWI